MNVAEIVGVNSARPDLQDAIIEKIKSLNMNDKQDKDCKNVNSNENFNLFCTLYGRSYSFNADYCSICSYRHKHFSSFELAFISGMSNKAEYACSDCKKPHSFYLKNQRVKLLLTSSTVASVIENSNGQISNSTHFDRIELRGCRIADMQKIVKNEIGPLSKHFSFDILIVVGVNNFSDPKYSLTKSVADILSLKYELESLNIDNTVNFMPIPLCPKFVKLSGDKFCPDLDRSVEVIIYNKVLRLLNSRPVPNLDMYGISDPKGQTISHLTSKWREYHVNSSVHLSKSELELFWPNIDLFFAGKSAEKWKNSSDFSMLHSDCFTFRHDTIYYREVAKCFKWNFLMPAANLIQIVTSEFLNKE